MHAIQGFGQKVLVGCAALVAMAIVGLADGANAQFDELIPTKVGIVKFSGTPALGKLYKLVSTVPKGGTLFKLPSADPATTGGSVTVGISPGRLDCTLAAQAYNGIEGWKTLGPPATPKGYKYINKSAPGGIAGLCKMILVKEKVINVVTKGTGGLPAPLGPGLNPDIDTVLTLGGDDYCAKADVPPKHFKEVADKLIKAKNLLPPAACPVIPTTTTTTVPGTTTTTGGATTTTTEGETTTTSVTETTTTTVSTTTTGGETTTTSVTETTTTTYIPPTTTTTLPPQPLDHYRLYSAVGPDGPFVHIEDQFHHGPDAEEVDLGTARYFLVPADKNGEGIINPADHLTCYDIPQGTFSAMVMVANQFGLQLLGVENPDALCVPTEKNPMPPGQPLERDHYKCYEAYGTPVMTPVTLVDQFQYQEVGALHPVLFCNPADKNGEGIVNDIDHLTCYATDPPGLVPGTVTISNQFHQYEYLELGSSMALCVPGSKLEWTPVTTTTTTVTAPTTTSTVVHETTTTITQPPETITTSTTTSSSTTITGLVSTTSTTFPVYPPCVGGAVPPMCDGWCPQPDQACWPSVGGGPCYCQTITPPFACADVGEYPECNGACPPQQACVAKAGICQCDGVIGD